MKTRNNKGSYTRDETLFLATKNEEIINAIEELAVQHDKKIYYAEEKSPDVLAVPCICIIGDKDFIGEDFLNTFYEISADSKDKLSKVFLYLTNEFSKDDLIKKVTEAILKVKGIYMYPHEKNYRISIKTNGRIGSFFTPVDFDNFDELKEIFELEKVKTITLGFHDIIDDSPNFHETGIKVNEFNQEHFEWITTKSYGMSRYLEV